MKLSTKIILGSAIVITLSATGSYTNYVLSKKVNTNTEFVSNSEAIIRNASRLQNQILEMQSAFRGFLLTEDYSFLQPYQEGLNIVPQLVKEQRSLSKDLSQVKRLEAIISLHQKWISYAGALLNAKQAAMTSAEQTARFRDLFNLTLRRKVGKALNDRISATFREFNSYEYQVRHKRREMLRSSIDHTHMISLVSISLTILICIISTIVIVRSIVKRIGDMVQLAERIAQGEFYIVDDHRNDELSSLSASLNIMSLNLQQNIRKLQNRNLELNQFASVVSHDLKAPLRGIYNVVSWIEEDLAQNLTGPMQKYLGIIRERITRMENLINGLLDYARISKEEVTKETVDVQHLVESVVDSIVPRDFDVQISGLPTIAAEKVRLEQVFSNLISNAVNHSKDTTGKITITCKELHDKYEFSVQDNGIGIDPQFHDKIFVIFQTLREKNSFESTGIGLSIVKKIIDEQQSDIRVESSLGNGAAFIFTWPK